MGAGPRPLATNEIAVGGGGTALTAPDQFAIGTQAHRTAGLAPVETGLFENPGAQVQIDLPGQTVTLPDGTRHAFEIDPFARHCLLNGVDEMAFTLSQVDQIVAFENRYGRENV